jgi:hypothetical protein
LSDDERATCCSPRCPSCGSHTPRDDEKAAQVAALVVKLGGDLDAVFFGAYRDMLAGTPSPRASGADHIGARIVTDAAD